jgi:hypothetical protein
MGDDMTTATDIIQKAAVRLRANPEGQTLPDYAHSRILSEMGDMLAEFPTMGIGGALYDEPLAAAGMTLTEPTRLVCNLSAAVIITLPLRPWDGFRFAVVDASANFATYNVTLGRNGRLIAGAAADATLATNGQVASYFYRADLGDWKAESAITAASDVIPYPHEFDSAISAMLAMRLWGEMGTDQPPFTLAQEAAEGLTRLQARYKQRRLASVDGGLLNMPSQSYIRSNNPTRRGVF